jgi:hypothetical protein
MQRYFPLVATSLSTMLPLAKHYTVVVAGIGILILGETTLITPPLDFCFDLVSLEIIEFFDDSIAKLESLAFHSLHTRILGDVLFPPGVDDGLQLLIVVEPRVRLRGSELSLRLFYESERFFSNLGSGHSTCMIVKPLPEAL